jgi:hypothetical protein
MNLKQNILGWGLLTAIFLFLFAPNLVREGMFVDGLWYAAISNNMAQGLGSFWEPIFTKTVHNPFYEHPPLVFGIQSVFFSVLGSGIWTERIYAFVVFIITAYLITQIWILINHDQPTRKKLYKYPVLLWMVNFGVFFAYPNNVLECTMTVFILLSIYWGIKALLSKKTPLLYIVLSALMILPAFLCKGPVALFPLTFFFISGLFAKKKSMKWFGIGGIHLIFFLLFSCLLLAIPQAPEFISTYWDQQVIEALKGNRVENMRANRWYILVGILKSMPVSVGLALIVLIFGFKGKDQGSRPSKKWGLVFLCIALSGSLPLTLSLKQAGYYLVPSIPFYVIGLAYFTAPYFPENLPEIFSRKKLQKVLTTFIVVVNIVGLIMVYNQFGKTDKRDRTHLDFVKKSIAFIPKGQTIGIHSEEFEHALHGYFQRYNSVALDTIKSNHKNYPFLIADKNSNFETLGDSIPTGHPIFRLIKTTSQER